MHGAWINSLGLLPCVVLFNPQAAYWPLFAMSWPFRLGWLFSHSNGAVVVQFDFHLVYSQSDSNDAINGCDLSMGLFASWVEHFEWRGGNGRVIRSFMVWS